MTLARQGQAATLLPSRMVLIAGGTSDTRAELYDPSTEEFAVTGSMTVTRVNPAAALLPSGMVLVAGSNWLASAELYDPAAGKFAATGSMTVAMLSPTAMLLPNGKVLIAGGGCSADSSCPRADLQLYDPAARTFAATFGFYEAYYTATLLPSGMVLIAGGYQDFSYGRVYRANAGLYDPGAGTFSATGSMTVARYSHTATLLPNGTVLIAGGGDNSSGSLARSRASAELCK
jgi:hypothetical protein